MSARIVRTEVNGRPALVSFFDRNFEPVEQKDAVLLKVRFIDDESGTQWLTPEDGEDE